MNILNNEKGSIKFIVYMLLLVSVIYAGIKFGMPYYRYSAFKSEAREVARISLGNTQRAKEQIFDMAQKLKLPLEEKDIIVRRTEKTVIVQASWVETVDLLGLYQKDLYFTIDLEE